VSSGLASYAEVVLRDHFLHHPSEPWKIEISDDLLNGFVHSLVAMCWSFMDVFNQLFLEFDRHID